MVDRSITPGNGHIVVAMLGGDFTVKRLRKRGERVLLEAEFTGENVIDHTPKDKCCVFFRQRLRPAIHAPGAPSGRGDAIFSLKRRE